MNLQQNIIFGFEKGRLMMFFNFQKSLRGKFILFVGGVFYNKGFSYYGKQKRT